MCTPLTTRAVFGLLFVPLLLDTDTQVHPHYPLCLPRSQTKWQVITVMYDVHPTNHKSSPKAALSFILSRSRHSCMPLLPSLLTTKSNITYWWVTTITYDLHPHPANHKSSLLGCSFFSFFSCTDYQVLPYLTASPLITHVLVTS